MKLETFLLLAGASSLALGNPTPKISKRQGGLQWVGVNEAGAEFGQNTLPGQLGKHYIWPDQNAMGQLMDAGLNMFRIAFMMERLVPNSMTGPPDQAYLADLIETVNFVTGRGYHAVLDPHNYGRYYGEVITSPDDFATFWTTLASNFVDNELVVFDTNNEYHSMDQQLVVDLNQAAINAIRATGATSQYIFVEGNSWTGAWTWVDINTSMGQLTDPEDKLVYEMHQYLDEDGSGTHDTCVSPTIGAERVAAATQWLRDNGKVGILGEFAGASNSVCQSAVSGMLDYLSDNSDVWKGALWWAAGPWWGPYMFSIEPPSGPALNTYLPILQAHT